jgi:hypothetical protein
MPLEAFKLEHVIAAALTLNAEKCIPVTDIVFMGTLPTDTAATKDTTTVMLRHDVPESEIPPPAPAAGNIAGNSTPSCVYNGNPSLSKVEIATLNDALAATNSLASAATLHTIGNIGNNGAAGVDRLRMITPELGNKTVDIVMFDGLRLEHSALAASTFRGDNCKPDTDMRLKKLEFSDGAAVNDTVKSKLRTLSLSQYSIF